MKTNKILSTLLAVIMLMSALVITAGAEEEAPVYTNKTTSAYPTIGYMKGEVYQDASAATPVVESTIKTAEDKLATMDLKFEKDGYRLYVDAYSGEVATYCIATGETLFSNPYNVGSSTATDSIKAQLLSQIVVKYIDVATGDENTYYSYTWAASRGQIIVKNIKNGIRVECTIGREEARMLVPRQIEKTAFETKILAPIAAELGENSFIYTKVKAYFNLKDTSTLSSATAIKEMESSYPITKKMAVYVLDSTTSSTEMAKLEGFIKTYCPNYTYEELDEDHLYTEYESEDENPPLFKMALEYTLDSQGVSVRLPANGIRFNETLYQLYSIEILPYMGAGANPNSGYTFFPDGSGTLFDFEKIASLGAATTVTGKIYGQDYAYHTISGTHQEIIRYPVFGIVETETFTTPVEGAEEAGSGSETEESTESGEEGETPEIPTVTTTKDRGFVAIVEGGDALMELSSYHAVRTSEYNTIRMTVYPRPQDTYNIADAISVGTNDTWTVVSSRKYTGNYKIRYIMLTDNDVAAEKGITDYYECSYIGMALAYRDYLVNNGTLTKLTSEDVKEDIPLYIETFGAMETTEKILSIPVDVMTPLTTFEDIQTMYSELAAKGIENVNFILTGFANGGMESTVPYKLKWESKVGGSSGFKDLIEYAKENGFGIFPDFDFAYISNNSLFDGATLKKHAVKTIDNRYTSKRIYSATKQTYIGYYDLAVSPAYFSHFYEKLTKNYLKYDPIGISVSTLGTDLNSDFDEDEPYNREDSKQFTIEAFEYLSSKYSKVMTSGGNAYTWKYVDYITDIALDSSRYAQSSASVPFLGIVLHGYVQFAGTPVNMEGNIDYALLKAIENGASLYFTLSYRNTENLKNDELLSQYYSVRYDIWFDDVVSIYNELNELLKDLQTSTIIDHRFLSGERVPDNDELEADAEKAMQEAIRIEQELLEAELDSERAKLLEARKGIVKKTEDVKTYSERAQSNLTALLGYDISTKVAEYNTAKSAYDTALADANAKKAVMDAKKAVLDGLSEDAPGYQTALEEFTAAETEYNNASAELDTKKQESDTAKENIAKYLGTIYGAADITATSASECRKAYETAREYLDILRTNGSLSNQIISDLEAKINAVQSYYEGIPAVENGAKTFADNAYDLVKDIEDIGVEPYVVTIIGSDTTDEEETEEEEVADNTSKYASDDNKIAYVTYENGTSFILNFNNYTVTTVVNGTVYTVDAYGYVVIKNS